MKKYQIITAIACAAAIGGVTEAVRFFPNIAEIASASNILLLAVSAFVLQKREAA
jgi:hypothetical protein